MTPNFMQRLPCPVLRPFIKRFLIVEASAPHQDVHLPETGFVAAFRFRGSCLLGDGMPAPTVALTGLWDGPRTHVHAPDYGVVIATFTATGAAAFLRRPVNEFTNTTADLALLLGKTSTLTSLSEQIATATSHATRLQLVSTFLHAYLTERQPDPEVSQAVVLIEQSQARLRMDALAYQVGLSQSALERRFRRHVGVSPRTYASLVRLHHVVRLQATGADFTTIAHAAGYTDQAHFNKDFKRFAGLAPSAFFAQPALKSIDELPRPA